MNHARQQRFCWIVTATLFGFLASGVQGEENPAIQAAIERGKAFLLSQPKQGAQGSLACYALVKAGLPTDHSDVQKSVAEVLRKCGGTGYVPGTHYNYEAGVDAMLLEAVDREAYLPQLQKIAAFLIATQRSHGAWYYQSDPGVEFGDTSITQYAVLGLWAASRAGVEIPIDTWQKVARWLMVTQVRDGGFTYHPNEAVATGVLNSTGTMTVAGTGTLLVVRYVLFGESEYDDGVRPATAPRRYGVLERIPDEKEKIKAKPKANVTIAVGAIDRSLKEGVRWATDRFGIPEATYENYYFYGIERMAALLDVTTIGAHNWYEEGAAYLLTRQAQNGSWADSCGMVPSTALTLLFLTKATASTINKPKRTPTVGGGLLIGGRGLPENLDAIQVKAGEVTKRKQHGPVDNLLAELEKSSDAKVEAAQEAIVEAVQLEHPEELIPQVQRLKRLVSDKRLEVRRTAMWALGRSGDITVAPYLIRGLADADESVVNEASAALCILSRRPNGCGVPPDPTEGLGEGATDRERANHLEQWKKTAQKQWNDWYLKVRPYDERDDRNGLKRKP